MPTFTGASLIAAGSGILLWSLLATGVSFAGPAAHQPVTGMAAVDETEVRGGLVKAEEFLEALRELAGFGAADAEGVGLAGAQPGLDVVDDHPEPRAGRGVGSGAVVEAAGEQQH